METAKTKFRGISRQLPYHQIPDGELDELINMRHDNGRLEPVGKKTKVYNTPGLDPHYDWVQFWIHDQDGLENFIGYSNNSKLWLINTGTGVGTFIKDYAEDEIVDVVFIKRFMVVVHEAGLDKFLYKDDEYILIDITQEPVFELSISDEERYGDYNNDTSLTATGVLGKYFENVNEASKDNKFNGGVMIRAAFKLYDGSYIMHTLPYFLSNDILLYTLRKQSAELGFLIEFWAAKAKITFAAADYSGLSDIKDVIQSVSVFACRNQSLVEISESTISDDDFDVWITDGAGLIQLNDELPVSDDFQKLPDSDAWYKVGEYALSGILDGTVTEETLDFDNFYQDYATREVLPVDQFSHHILSGNVQMNYNSRLILADTIQKLAVKEVYQSPEDTEINILTVPSPATYLTYTPTGSDATIIVNFIIDTETGEKNVWTTQTIPEWETAGSSYNAIALRGVIGYPDARAKTCQIFVLDSGQYKRIANFNLVKHGEMNYAYIHANDDLIEGYGFETESYEIVWAGFDYGTPTPVRSDTKNFKLLIIVYDRTTLSVANNFNDAVAYDNEITDTNRVQVSEVNNPFFFPAENSYQVGTGKVIGVASNSEPLSTGQFGEYPLQVFTTKGVWALLQGQGDVVFSNIVPSSSEVANEGTILSVGNGVVFATALGLYLLSGRDLTELTEMLKGLPNSDFQANTNYQFFLDDVRLVSGLNTKLSDINILEYLLTSKLGFDKVNRELIVTNSAKPYSYVYEFNTGFWHKIDESFSILINYYPKLYALRESGDDAGIISLSDETYVNTVNVLLTSQPMKLGAGDNFKVLQRTVLRCTVTPETSTHAGFYIFASSDLITWQRVKGINHLTGKKRDFLLTRTGGKAKYYIFVFAGQISCDSYIDSLDTLIDLKLNNKLR